MECEVSDRGALGHVEVVVGKINSISNAFEGVRKTLPRRPHFDLDRVYIYTKIYRISTARGSQASRPIFMAIQEPAEDLSALDFCGLVHDSYAPISTRSILAASRSTLRHFAYIHSFQESHL